MMADAHNKAWPLLLRTIIEHAEDEAAQWVILETLCLGVGKLHGRTPDQTAIFVENIAERLIEGKRQ